MSQPTARPDPGQYHLLVVSDLHLSEGRDARSKSFSRNEDFFFDEEFARFLDHYQQQPRSGAAGWHLVINGDFLDLLQVVTLDGAAATLDRDLTHPDYGLACGDQETVFKLGKIADGHWRFFEALAAFADAGNLLTILKGNHDVELHYPLVRQAIVDELQKAWMRQQGAAGKPAAPSAAIAANVHVGDWFHHEPRELWIEHGNQYDATNSFKYWLSPLLPDDPTRPSNRAGEIDLPLGSLFVRYLFNRIERTEPFADNIKPATKFAGWLLRKHPITFLRFAFGDGRYMLKKVRRAWGRVDRKAWAAREAEHLTVRARLAHESGIPPPQLEHVDAMAAPTVLRDPAGVLVRAVRGLVRARLALPLLLLLTLAVLLGGGLAIARLLVPAFPGAIRELLAQAIPKNVEDTAGVALLVAAIAFAIPTAIWLLREEKTPGPSYLAARARSIAEVLGVRYVVMGHTHDAECLPIGKHGGRDREYFNTGTWTKVFSEEEQLIRKPVEFVFVQGLRRPTGLQMKVMEWNDEAGEPRLLKLFRQE